MMRACGLVSRLLERMRRGKCGKRKTTVGETRDQREILQLKFKKMRADHLAGDADVRQTRLGTQGKGRGRAARQKPFIGRKPFAGPMLAPTFDRLGIGAERLGEM